MAEKMLTPEEKAAAMPVIQSAMQAYQQHYGIKLTEQETSRVMDRALNNLNSQATPSEVRGAVRNLMLEVLTKNDPARATELQMQAQGVPGSERSRIPAIAENEGANAANAGLPKEAGAQTPAQSPMFLGPKHGQETQQEQFASEQKKIIGQIFAISPKHFQEAILSKIEPLKPNATSEERMEKIKELFNLIKKGGVLGIEYQFSEGRPPKTPNEVLTPEKDGKMRADCDELSLFFIAAARKLNIDLSDVSIAVVKFEAQNPVLLNKKEPLHAAILTIGNEKALLDPVFGIMEKMNSFGSEDLLKAYNGKFLPGNFMIVGVLDVKIASDLADMASIHFHEKAKYYASQFQTEKAISTLEIATAISPNSINLKEELLGLYLNIADEAVSSGKISMAEANSKKALLLGSKISSPGSAVIDNLYHAHDVLGSAYMKQKKYSAAISEFDEMIRIKPAEPLAYYNKSYILYGLAGDAYRAGAVEDAKKYLSDAESTMFAASQRVAEEKYDQNMMELFRLIQEKRSKL